MQLGHKAKTAEDAQDAYHQSVKYYVEAAQTYPQDEEAAITFYKVAVEGYWYLPKGARLGDTAELISKISLLYEDVMKIWGQSAASGGRNRQISQVLGFAHRCEDAMKAGKLTFENLVRPKEWVCTVLLLYSVCEMI